MPLNLLLLLIILLILGLAQADWPITIGHFAITMSDGYSHEVISDSDLA